jgi:hypothetical protein
LADGRIVFLAAAEASKNAYDDGKFVGSAVGLMDKAGDVLHLEPVGGSYKLEGISARQEEGKPALNFVSDTDDQNMPSALFGASWSM